MKLVHVDLNRQMIIPKQGAAQWVIESPEWFASCVQELYQQCQGEEGRVVLSEKDNIFDFAKTVEIILNPFAVDLHDKRITTKLYQELQSVAYGEQLFQKTQEIAGILQSFFWELEQQSPYLLEMKQALDIPALLKAMGVQIEQNDNSFFETMNTYIQLMAELLHKKLIIFVQIGQYFTVEQRRAMQETAANHDIALLFIESQELDFANSIPRYIIDIDGCEI